MDGVFLKRGQYTYPLDKERVWHFVPLVKVGDEVGPSAWLGQVDENFQPLKLWYHSVDRYLWSKIYCS